MEDLILRLRVEEDHRKGDKTEVSALTAKANVVEGEASKTKFQKHKGKKFTNNIHAPKGKPFKKVKGNCWVCGKPGHRAHECRHRKDQPAGNSNHKNQANVTATNEDLVAVISEVNMIDNVKGWWIDTGATRHICGDKALFSTFEDVTSDEKLYMGNSSTSSVKGKGKIWQKFHFWKSSHFG